MDIFQSREKVHNNCMGNDLGSYQEGNRNILEHRKDSNEVEECVTQSLYFL